MNARQAKNITWDLGDENQSPIILLTKARKERRYKIMCRACQHVWQPIWIRKPDYGNKRWRQRARVFRKWGIV